MIVTAGGETSKIDAQVAIVGAGPAGIALALALARAGIDTAVIESGHIRPDKWTMSLSPAAAISPTDHVPIEWGTHRRLGGASWVWGGRCVDFDPIDFEPRPDAEVPGWPISYKDATCKADAAADFLGIGEPEFDTRLERIAGQGALRVRLERFCADPRLARRHAAEINSSGRARFYTGLTCTGVALDRQGGSVTGLRARTRSGAARLVTARNYVIAAGGIETARLLLASDDIATAGSDGGLPWLGRGYMGHTTGAIADIVFDDFSENAIDYRLDKDLCFVRPRLMLASETIRQYGLLNTAFLPVNPPLGDWRHRSGPLSMAAVVLSTPLVGRRLQPGPIRQVLLGQPIGPGNLSRHLRNILYDWPSAAGFTVRAINRLFIHPPAPGMFVRNRRRRYHLKFYCEQTPAFASRIRLSSDRDAVDLRRVIIEKSIPSSDVESILKAHEILDKELRRLKLGRLEYHGLPAALSATIAAGAADGYHQIGLTRMSDGKRWGVVDRDCRVHGIRNFYLAGSAVFSTSGQANPTFLIVCLTLRLAEHLIRIIKAS